MPSLAAALAAALVLGGCTTGKTIAIEQQGSFTVGAATLLIRVRSSRRTLLPPTASALTAILPM
jgi:hypothetical protein